VLASSLLVGCGDDGSPSTGSETGTTAGPDASTSGTSTLTSTSLSTTTDDTTEGSSEESSGSTGEPPVARCVADELPGPLSGAQWDERFTVAGLAGQDGIMPIARDLVLDDDGALLVAGYFRWGDGRPMSALARHDDAWTGAPRGWNALPDSGFTALALGPEGELAAASNDLAMHGDGEIRIDDDLVATHSGAIRRLQWIDGVLWAAGWFAIDDGPTSLALWNGSTWAGASGGDPDAPVYEILVEDDGDVLVAGEFAEIGGVPAQKVARWTGTDWEALDMPEAARVLALEVDGDGVLWAGGVFTLAPENLPSASLARWTGTAWELAAGGVAAGEATGVVNDLLWVDGAMYVGGCFDAVGPGAQAAGSIARLVDDTWEALGDGPDAIGMAWLSDLACGFEPNPGAVFSIPVQRMLHDGERLWVAGGLAGLGGVPSQSIVALVDDAWEAVDAPGLGVSGNIDQLAVGGESCDVFALASATHAGGEALESRVVRWDEREGFVSAAPPLPASQSCTEIEVGTRGEMWIGCASYDPTVDGDVLVLDGEAWSSAGDVPGPVHDIALAQDDTLWIAGGDLMGYLARLRGDELEIVEDAIDLPALLVEAAPNGDVVIGGPFASIGDVAASRVARFDGEGWQPLGEGVTSTPSAIAVDDDAVWVATFDEGLPGRMVLGRFDGEAWEEMATPARGLPAPMGESTHTFVRLRPVGEGLLAVGYVWPETGGRNAFFFDGESFDSIAGGIAAVSVDDALITEDAILFAGWGIAEVGAGEAHHSSVGVARLHW
jgi:hypothetical protein